MNPHDAHPIDFFSEWFAEPFAVRDNSVAGIIDALNRHPMARDQTATDYVMPTSRCREHAGRFRIYRENQDVFYCFVYDGDVSQTDPPVYFESGLDLNTDYGIDKSKIIDDDHCLVAERFTDFLWHILGNHICLRMESGGRFTASVSGILFDGGLELDATFVNPMRQEFPAGYTCFMGEDVICVPDWGAAFLTARACDAFMARYSPNVSRRWA